MQVEIAVTPSQHVEDDVEENGRDDDPSEDDAELDFSREELEEAERHVKEDRAGEV